MTRENRETIRIGVLGAGDVAARHLEGLLLEEGTRLTWLAEPDPGRREAFAASFDIPRTTAEAQEVVEAEDVDLVLVLTPHDLHCPQTVAALEAGKDVFCEKPMARGVAECDTMLEAAARCGRRLLVTHALRAKFFHRTAVGRLDAGAIGRPLLGSFRWHTDETRRLEDERHWKGTRDRSGGGVFIDGGCHVADLGNAYFGPARRVSAHAARMVTRQENRGEDNGVFVVEYAGGATASYALSFTAGSAYRIEEFGCGTHIDLYGTAGHVECGFLIRDWVVREYYREHRPGVPDADHPPPPDLPIIDQLFLRALRQGTAPPVSAVDARNAVAVVEAAYRSLESARSETVDWRDDPPS